MGAPCRHRWTKVKCTAKRAARRRSNGLLTRRSLALTPQYPEPLQAARWLSCLMHAVFLYTDSPRSTSLSRRLVDAGTTTGRNRITLVAKWGQSALSLGPQAMHAIRNGNDGSGAPPEVVSGTRSWGWGPPGVTGEGLDRLRRLCLVCYGSPSR